MHKSSRTTQSRPQAKRLNPATRLNSAKRTAAQTPESPHTPAATETQQQLSPQFDFSQISIHAPGIQAPSFHAPGQIAPDAAAAVARGLRAAKSTISPGDAATLSNFLATDVSRLVVHSGPDASAASKALGARAFTVGRHIVMSSSVTPSATNSTFLHEAIHARQQNFADLPSDLSRLRITSPSDAEETAAAVFSVHSVSNRPIVIARQTASQPQPQSPLIMPPTTPSFADVFRKFKGTSDMYAAAEKRQLALQALNLLLLLNDARLGGAELLNYFFSKGMTAEGEKTMKAVVDLWTIDHVVQGSIVPAATLAISGPPATLEAAGESAARAGNHEQAFRLFGNAFLLLSFQAADASEKRERDTSTRAGQQMVDATRTLIYYPSVRQIYASMRTILDFYNVLSDEAHAAGNDQMAASYSGLALMLYTEIRQSYVWDNDPETVAEVELVSSSKGDALRIHGDNGKTQDLTPLPGLPAPAEVTSTGKPGSLAPQWQKAPDLVDALHNQIDLMRELKAYPEIQKEFGTTDIDMNNLDHRLRVWKTMLKVYTSSASSFGGGGLSSLMSLIHRYLRAYTFHTGYNVDDFGQSYLDDKENTMPADLAGRLERDCGVYALTVAYEVFRTAKSAAPPLHISFRVFTMPDHVTLVIDDLDRKEYYVLNNDQISPAKQGDPMRDVAGGYAAIRKVKNLVAPSIEMKLGDTTQSDAQFRNQAWSRYKDSASWGLDVPKDSDRDATYSKYYEAEKTYDSDLPALQSKLDALSGSLKSQDATQQLATLDAQAPALIQGAAGLLVILESHGPRAPITTSRPDPALQSRLKPQQRFLYSSETPGRDHPLARTVMLLDFWRSRGHKFDQLQQVFWDDFQKLGTKAPDLAAELARYLGTGGGPAF
jgi:hypothetical protein